MMDMVEFDCEGCGVHVATFGPEVIPKNHMCATCEWACEHIPDPDEFWEFIKRMRKE